MKPLPAPDATRSLLRQTLIELTQEYTDEGLYLSAVRSPFSARWDPITSYPNKGQVSKTKEKIKYYKHFQSSHFEILLKVKQ